MDYGSGKCNKFSQLKDTEGININIDTLCKMYNSYKVLKIIHVHENSTLTTCVDPCTDNDRLSNL